MMSSMIIPLFILVVPILDTLFAIIRRKLKGESVTMPDKSHIHHLLLKKNFTQRQTVLIIYLITILFSTTTIIYTLISQKIGIIFYSILVIIFIIFIYKLGIIFSKNIDKTNQFSFIYIFKINIQGDKNMHNMKLQEKYYNYILNGTKRIELIV